MPTRFQVKPTFPLDEALIKKYRRRRIWSSPITWTVLAGSAILTIVSRSFGGAAISGVSLGGLYGFWTSRLPKVDVDAVQEIINASNRKQDEELQRIIRVLEDKGHHQYALSLGKFLMLKQRIESQLHAEGELNDQKQKIEVLVDSLCDQVCNQITELTNLNDELGETLTSGSADRLKSLQAEIDKCHKRVMKAYQVMCETAGNLGTMLAPGVERENRVTTESQMMDRLIDQLAEENEVAQAIHKRLKEVN